MCSGISRWILTAAHCLIEYFGTTDVYLGIRADGSYEKAVQVERTSFKLL